MILVCKYCRKEFVKSFQRRKYCSIDCQIKFRRRLDKVKAGDRKSEKIRRDSLPDSIVKKAIYIGSKGKITYDQITSEMIIEKRIGLLAYRKRQEERKANPPKPRNKTRICIVCGKTYEVKGASLFCSKECRNQNSKNKYYANREIILRKRREKYRTNWIQPEAFKCKYCGVIYKPKFGEKVSSYCSEDCSKKNENHGNNRKRARHYNVAYEPIDFFKVFTRDRWHCQICGKATPIKNRGTLYTNAPELDHRVPMSRGGGHLYSNVQCACRKCNGLKSNLNSDGQLPLFDI